MAFDAPPPIPSAAEERHQMVRSAVRGLLERTPEYAALPLEKRRVLAHDLVQLTDTSLMLLAEEQEAAAPEPLATEQAVTKNFTPQANRQVGQQIQQTLDGIAFPRFVTELVNGVFKGLIDANAQQMQAYVDMIAGVTSATADSGQNTGPDQARVWLVQQFPDNYELGTQQDIWGDQSATGTAVVTLREGKDAPKAEDVAAMLELEGEEAQSLSPDDPEESLLPKVRAYLARKRQKVLASLLTLGMNRIVIDHGKIKAGMNFAIDAHSAAEENRARRFEMAHTSSGGASFGAGPWGVNASMTNSIGVVSTKQTHQREDMSQQVNMNADVELHFHSDYLPLNQLAAKDSVARIKAASLNPQAPVRSSPSGPTSSQKAADGVVSKPVTMPKAPDPPKTTPAKTTPAKTTPAKTTPAKTTPAKTTPAKTTTPAKK
ncbi:hypothetical protein [Roseovarius faecimaris]|uniref:hypothetical protein n=1 Tax=Roseovarius faecimaris TaxID=2494550 RepID=UPI0018E00030|nr:hypothetical protein [Roseovarius faecimaris]